MRTARPARSLSLVASLATALAIASVVACAQGTNGADDDDDVRVDARRVDARLTDARTIDAPGVPVDARPVDASIGLDSGLPGLDGGLEGSCTQHTDCPTGNCCFGGLMCIPGNPLPLPPPFDCLPQ